VYFAGSINGKVNTSQASGAVLHNAGVCCGNFATDFKQWVISLWGGRPYDDTLLLLESV
jgi:hypothetical protein